MRSSPCAATAIFMAASARFCQSNSTTSLIPTSLHPKYSGIEEISVRITTGGRSPVWDMPSQLVVDARSGYRFCEIGMSTKQQLTAARRFLLRKLLDHAVSAADERIRFGRNRRPLGRQIDQVVDVHARGYTALTVREIGAIFSNRTFGREIILPTLRLETASTRRRGRRCLLNTFETFDWRPIPSNVLLGGLAG